MQTLLENDGFSTCALAGLIFISISLVFTKYQPKKINRFIGYRTRSSMGSPERWAFAQAYWPPRMLISGVLLLGFSSIYLLLDLPKDSAVLSAVIIVIIGAFYPIIATEKALKEAFG